MTRLARISSTRGSPGTLDRSPRTALGAATVSYRRRSHCRRPSGTRLLLIATSVLFLTACSGAHDVDPLSPPDASTIDPSEQETSFQPSETQAVEEQIKETVQLYFATVDRVRQRSSEPSVSLESVASSSQLIAQQELLENQREAGLRQVGGTEIVELRLESVSLGDPAIALVDVCWDVRAVDVVDGERRSVVTPERKNVGWTRYTVTNDKWESTTDDGWRVSGGADLEKEPCTGP